ncbi:MAG: ImmA/IrrE family metallo-endopeptidase [Bacillota bacterium]|nr:ImmA/IrrE family metallo-endopeptidase [Bacillota bacterium]
MISDEAIYKSVDYTKVYCKANELLVSSNVIESFPFKVSAFIKEQSDIRLCKYAKAFEKYGIPIKHFGSESAVIMEYYGAIIIFYNQDEAPYRTRFGIMHEFGHYILGHKFNLKEADPLYHKQELEANCFAAQMLMPEQILRECKNRGKYISVDYIMESFEVSEDAATKRKKTLANTVYEWKSRSEREYDDIIVLKYASLINKIAPMKPYEYDFDEEYNRQAERDSWYANSRSRW